MVVFCPNKDILVRKIIHDLKAPKSMYFAEQIFKKIGSYEKVSFHPKRGTFEKSWALGLSETVRIAGDSGIRLALVVAATTRAERKSISIRILCDSLIKSYLQVKK